MRISSANLSKRTIAGYWALLLVAVSTFLCIFSSLEIESSNAQLVAALLSEPIEQLELSAVIQENESLDKQERSDREDLEQALPHTSHNKNQLSQRPAESTTTAKQWIVPLVKLIQLPDNLVGANESYYNLPLCFLYCSLLI